MPIFRKREGLTGAFVQSLPIFQKAEKGRGRTLKSLTVGFVDQPSVITDLTVVPYPIVTVVLQTLDPDIYGVLTHGDVGFITSSDITCPSMVSTSGGGTQVGFFPSMVQNNFKDIKTVDPIWVAVSNFFGVVELAIMIEYSEIVISDGEAVKVVLGADR